MTQKNAIGLLELNSIAAGLEAADLMLKTAQVELLLARTICSGKYLVIVGGDTAAVQMSVAAGAKRAEGGVIDKMVVAQVHPDIFPALGGANRVEKPGALGVLEAFSAASLLEGADAAAKAANVQLVEIRLAMALGGKAFCTLTGDVANVRAAVEAGAKAIARKGLLVNSALIPAPNPALFRDFL